MLGLNRKIVKLIPFQKEWRDEFNKEKNFLLSILKTNINIEHVGSTAIEGLLAKPIIDLMIGLTPEIKTEVLFTILSNNGYEDKGDDGVPGEDLFVKGPDNNRTHYIHIVNKDSTAWNNYLGFRDYLKSHKTALEEYNLLKIELAKKYSNNRKSYTNGKADFIKKILTKAQGNKNA